MKTPAHAVVCLAVMFAQNHVSRRPMSDKILPFPEIPDSVTEQIFTNQLNKLVHNPARAYAKALPLEFLLGPKCTHPANLRPLDEAEPKEITERILARLIQSQAHEPDVWMRDDYQIAWHTILLASRGNSEPHTVATYQVLGIHPAKVWPKIVAVRKALLGREFSQMCYADGNFRPDIPKKASTSASLPFSERRKVQVPNFQNDRRRLG